MALEVLRAEQLTRRYRETAVVAAVDFRIEEGEGVCLLGGNGAGKTTLLGMAASLVRPSAGAIFYWGRPAADALPGVRGRIGYASHRSLLYPELTVRENLALHRRLHGGGADLDELLADWRLTLWADTPARQLSRGTGQRATLARALLHEPALLLLDEPFAGLDGPSRDRLADRLQRERERGATLVLATHDLDRGLTLTERTVVLRGGRKVRDEANADRAEIERAYAAGDPGR